MGGNPDIGPTYAQAIAAVQAITALVVAVTAFVTVLNTIWLAYLHRKLSKELVVVQATLAAQNASTANPPQPDNSPPIP